VAVARLEEARKKFSAKLDELELEKENLESEILKSRQAKQSYETSQRQGLGLEAKKILKELTALRDEVSRAVKEQRPEELAKGSLGLFQKISDSADKVRVFANENENTLEAIPLGDDEIVVGALVDVDQLGLATLLELPNAKGLALVQMGDLKTRVARERLLKPPRQRAEKFLAQKAAQGARRKGAELWPKTQQASKSGSGSLLCDVRGKTVDEALRRIESSLNDLLKEDFLTLTIIHGHGSDRLKDSIRDYLKGERADVAYRPGSWPGEGGDGVTVVERSF
jgi:DNA mismatch repair protein MutS2